MQGVRTIHDLDARLQMMDEFGDYSEILSLGLPPIDAMAGPDKSPEFARVANDGLAELCAKYPGRFAGYVGALPMNAPDEAAKEAERILIEELSGRGWDKQQLCGMLKADPEKLKIAQRLRTETSVSLKWIAEKLSMGAPAAIA